MTTMTSPAPNTARERWELAENQTMSLPRRRVATVVRVERGTVLVTQQGDYEDHVLEQGDELVVRRSGLAVAWAFTEATISMREVGRSRNLALARDERAETRAGADDLEHLGVRFAHELKNPLTGVKALVQLGLRNPDETPSHERLAVVEREVTRMQEILQRYLSFTRRLQEMSPARIDLGPFVSDTLLVLSAWAAEARVQLISYGDATIEADPRGLREALLNLVSNGIEATPPGGAVVVEVRASGDGAEIVVRDTGRGMPSETLARVGTPFFTTREDGTGLGVVLARSVIAQHGGSLRYESEPGRGTTVKATFPGRVGVGAIAAVAS
ncbi:MAG TPA: ATP-binding protein [Anaeromyxobacter sp.]|nr:ATP-binding protein [Anaeromyxobacter sp.]